MERRPSERVLAFVLAVAMTVSPVLAPMSAYAEEASDSGVSVATLGDDDSAYNETFNSNETIGDFGADYQMPDESFAEGESAGIVEQYPEGVTDDDPQANDTNVGTNETTAENNATAVEEVITEENSTNTTDVVDVQTEKKEDDKSVLVALNADAKAPSAQWVTNKDVAAGKTISLGVAGKGIEFVRLSLALNGMQGGITYRGYTSKNSWTEWTSNGAELGVSGGTLQAVRIKLTGEIANQYSIRYRVNAQNKGWLGWTSDGELAGTSGLNLRAESIELQLVEKNGFLTTAASKNAYEGGSIIAQAYVQNKAWMKKKSGSLVTIGTTGKSLRLQGIRLKVEAGDYKGNIKYEAYLQDSGWQNPTKKNWQMAGTKKSKRIEAVKVQLDGELDQHYDIYYRVHVRNIGWMDWAKNGNPAGSVGFGLAVEAMQIALVPQGSGKPTSNPKRDIAGSYIDKTSLSVEYNANMKKKVQSFVKMGKTAGKTKKNNKITGMRINLKRSDGIKGSIKYRVHQANIGWGSWKKDGALAGNKKNQIECIKIKLTGTASKLFDVYYRVRVKTYGWLGWAKNGASAGSVACGIAIQAYQVRVVPKGTKAPGKTESPMVNNVVNNMYVKAQDLNSPSSYVIMVDDDNCLVGIFKGKKGNRDLVMKTKCGTPGGNAVAGVFGVTDKYYTAGGGGYCEYYVTEGFGSGSFHSILCIPGTFTPLYDVNAQLRKGETHGCIRLPLDVARYIYTNIPRGSTICVYNVKK